MIFTQINFIIFFIVVLVFIIIVKNNRARKIFLLISSYYFYAYWDYRFVSLLFIYTVVNYAVGFFLSKTDVTNTRKALLTLNLIFNLGVLGIFKYYNFFISSFEVMLAPLGWHLKTLNIILPIGISFYTFHTLSYTIDLYKRKIEVCKDFLDFALFVAFFPQMVAGPIVRASEFLPQLKISHNINWENAATGFRQFTLGLFKKVFIADRLAMFVDYNFENAGLFDCTTTWLAVAAYSIQIYCDFSGYSDMAIGIARIMGYSLPQNFNFPYISKSISEFWHRWHISLSTWIRDYLYIPLGGSKQGRIRTYINLIFTMIIIGLWHGAAWNFIFWGGFHGVALAINRLWASRGERGSAVGGGFILSKITSWGLTMVVVMIGWVFFRAKDFQQASLILRQMFIPEMGIAWISPFVVSALLGATIVHLWEVLAPENDLAPIDAWYTPAVLFSLIWMVLIFHPTGFNPFIYFQF